MTDAHIERHETVDLGDPNLPTPSGKRTGFSLHLLQSVPEENLWLAGQLSVRTRRAYKQDVAHFVATMGVRSNDELRRVNRAVVVAWQDVMREHRTKARTVRRRLSALSSLFAHLVDRGLVDLNPVRELKRPRVNRRKGTTRAFSAKEARRILDAPDTTTLRGLRDRAILSIGFQAGPRRAEIVSLLIKDFNTNGGYKSLHSIRKGGEDLLLALNPQTAQRIYDYLAAAGHADDRDGPLLRPLGGNQHRRDVRRHLHAETVDRVLRKYAAVAGLDSGYSAHSMRATFITTALSNGARLEDVQRDVGHADPTTTKLYDRRGSDQEKSAAFFATY